MIKYKFDEVRNCYIVSIASLELKSLDFMISFLRSVKQTRANFIILEFDKNPLITNSQKTVSERLEWSKTGQLLTNLLEALPLSTVAVINGVCTGEYLEIAMACQVVWIEKQASIDYSYGDGLDFPRFGSLKRLQAQLGSRIVGFLQQDGEMPKTWKLLLASKKQDLFDGRIRLEELMDLHAKSISSRSILARRLISYQQASLPTMQSDLDYLEATVYANIPYIDRLKQIKFMGGTEFADSRMEVSRTGVIITGLDDIGNDYMKFKSFPDKEVIALQRKSRIEEVNLLLKQKMAPVRGRCIELGSGYGYFSALASKSSIVTEAIALDISAAEIYQLGPFMWERLQPDWSKFSLRISDMNKLSNEYGLFDTVIFCASLHHSGDIPKSLHVAYDLLKKGGSLIIHGEHYAPMLFQAKKRKKTDSIPRTIRDFKYLLKESGFEPKVFRYSLPGGRFPWLRRLIFTIKPFSYVNGYLRFHSYMMLGIKN